MIYVGDKQADLKDAKSTVGKEFALAKKYFKTIGFPIRFKVKKHLLTRNETEDGQVSMSMCAWHIHHSALVNTEFGSEFWRYSPTPAFMKDGVLSFPTEGRYKSYSTKVVKFREDQADLAFFLWYKSKPFQNVYDIDDPKKEARETVEAKMAQVQLDGIFFGKDSLLRNDEGILATICLANNVPDTNGKDKNQRLVALEGIIREKVRLKQVTVDEFAESLQLDILTELSANISKAFEDKLITFDAGQSAWFYIGDEGKLDGKIVHVPLSQKESHFNYLRDYLKGNQTKLDEFEKHLEKVPNKDLTIDLDRLEDLDWTTEILPFINKVGIGGTGFNRTKETIYAEIREKCS